MSRDCSGMESINAGLVVYVYTCGVKRGKLCCGPSPFTWQDLFGFSISVIKQWLTGLLDQQSRVAQPVQHGAEFPLLNPKGGAEPINRETSAEQV